MFSLPSLKILKTKKSPGMISCTEKKHIVFSFKQPDFML